MIQKYKQPIYISLLTLLLLGSLSQGFSQGCIETLRNARTVYDEGRLHELPDILKSCLKKGFTEEEKTEAYRLLVLSYIYQDQPALADETMLALLRSNPLYDTDEETDPNELINLLKTFRTNPVFRWGIKVKGTYSAVNIIKTYSIGNSLNSNGKYTGDVGFGVALFAEKDFVRNQLTVRFEPSFTTYKMTYTGSAFEKDDSPDETTVDFLDEENQSWIGVDLLARYSFLKNTKFGKKITPTFILGPSGQFLFSSNSSNTTGVKGGESASGADLDFKETNIRKAINISGVAGIGIIVPLGKMSFITDLTYQYGLVNITDKNNSSELNLRYGRAMSDLSLNAFNISFGLMFNVYSPKKLSN